MASELAEVCISREWHGSVVATKQVFNHLMKDFLMKDHFVNILSSYLCKNTPMFGAFINTNITKERCGCHCKTLLCKTLEQRNSMAAIPKNYFNKDLQSDSKFALSTCNLHEAYAENYGRCLIRYPKD